MPETSLIKRSDDILGGTPVFTGTRVPVQTLFDYLEGGDSLDIFLDDFPAVSREHAIKILEKMKEAFLAQEADGQVFILKPVQASRSALDVVGINLNISTEEIVEIIREERERL